MATGEKAALLRALGGGGPSVKHSNRHHLPSIFVTSLWFSVVQTIFPSIPFLFSCFFLRSGKTLEEAADSSLGYMKSKLKGLGGVILINTAGDWAVKWTSASMPWAAAKDGKLHSGIDLDETSIADLP